MPETPEYLMDVNAIKKIIPHRFPFLLVDRVIEINEEKSKITAIKNVTMNEPHFPGHYPEMPVMPGVLQVEAMAQAACILFMDKPENKDKVPFFTGIDAVKFRKQVIPGDQLRIEVETTAMRRRVAKCDAKAYVGDKLAVEAKLTCMLGDKE
ncbi:MAG: 3-hydroxyacyl-ACP dehydratase FabZ [Candidatus Sumerlaeota bacterium]